MSGEGEVFWVPIQSTNGIIITENVDLRSGLLSLPLEQSQKRDTYYLHDLEAAAGDITLGFTALTETRDQHLVILIDEVEATIARDEASDLLAVLDKLNTHSFTNSRVRLLRFQTTVNRTEKIFRRQNETKKEQIVSVELPQNHETSLQIDKLFK